MSDASGGLEGLDEVGFNKFRSGRQAHRIFVSRLGSVQRRVLHMWPADTHKIGRVKCGGQPHGSTAVRIFSNDESPSSELEKTYPEQSQHR